MMYLLLCENGIDTWTFTTSLCEMMCALFSDEKMVFTLWPSQPEDNFSVIWVKSSELVLS